MTSDDMHVIASMAAREAVDQTFLALGVDISTPAGIISHQHDLAFLRSARLVLRALRTHALTVLVGLMVTGVAYAVWAAVRAGSAAAGK